MQITVPQSSGYVSNSDGSLVLFSFSSSQGVGRFTRLGAWASAANCISGRQRPIGLSGPSSHRAEMKMSQNKLKLGKKESSSLRRQNHLKYFSYFWSGIRAVPRRIFVEENVPDLMDVVISSGEKRIIFHASTAQHMQLIKSKRMSLPLAVRTAVLS